MTPSSFSSSSGGVSGSKLLNTIVRCPPLSSRISTSNWAMSAPMDSSASSLRRTHSATQSSTCAATSSAKALVSMAATGSLS